MTEEKNFLSGYRVARSVARVAAGEDPQQCLEELANQERLGADQQRELDATWRALANVEGLSQDEDIQQILEQVEREPTKAPHRLSRRNGVWTAVAAAIVVTIVSLVLLVDRAPEMIETEGLKRYVTRVGEQKQILLEDGTAVTLNTGSELLVDIAGEERRTVLRRGEAYFDVARDAKKRFFVEVGDKSVSVLGTEFNLHRRSGGFSLAVAEGEVAVHAAHEPVLSSATLIGVEVQENFLESDQRRVTAGWRIDIDQAANILTAVESDISGMSAWRTGVLHFVDQPLVSVVKELNRYSAKKILIEDASIMNKPVTATVRIDGINAALKGLAKAQSLQITHNFDHIVIVSKK